MIKFNFFKKNQPMDLGFTLLEVLIAITILSFGLLGIAKMQISSIKANASAQKISSASSVAGARIELLMSAPYSVVTANLNVANTDSDSGYSVEWTASNERDLNGDGFNDIVDVSVVVDDSLGNERVRLTFLKPANI